ncbi:MAG: NAD-dependent deacylase [Desulfurococcales archaeon]|nr:NAD-dependent deacylase [Desulfurococcales archaeon]
MRSLKSYQNLIEKIAEKIIEAEGCSVVLTGAGISTPSGIPDFRSPGGLWSRIDPSIFELSYFHSRPDISWIYYRQLVGELEDKQPNPAHKALAELEEMGLIKAVITQNIDGLHQRAGSRKVLEIHGNAYRAVCTSCGSRYPIHEALEKVGKGEAPRCSKCGGLLKPDVVFFGEPLPYKVYMESLQLARKCKVFLSVGSSLVVQPAASLPWHAHSSGVFLAIVNLQETPLDSLANAVIHGRVEEILPGLVLAIKRRIEVI